MFIFRNNAVNTGSLCWRTTSRVWSSGIDLGQINLYGFVYSEKSGQTRSFEWSDTNCLANIFTS